MIQVLSINILLTVDYDVQGTGCANVVLMKFFF